MQTILRFSASNTHPQSKQYGCSPDTGSADLFAAAAQGIDTLAQLHEKYAHINDVIALPTSVQRNTFS